MFRCISLATVALAASLSACASTHDITAPPAALARPSRGAPAESELHGAAEGAVRAPVLGRDAFVRAVLERNPTLEAARHGFRAAVARVRQSGAFDDPMLELGVAPLSI